MLRLQELFPMCREFLLVIGGAAAGVMLCLASSALFIIVRSRTDMAD
jgi:hypothetical protein